MQAQTSCSLSNALSYGTDTTDAEQGDLPYEGDVRTAREYNNNSCKLNGCTCTRSSSEFLNFSHSEANKNASANCDIHAQPGAVLDCNTGTRGTTGISAATPGREATFTKELPVGGGSEAGRGDPLPHSKMSTVFWCSFPKGESMSTWQLIECETIPETSLTESTDETTNRLETLTGQQQAAKFEEHHLERLKVVNTGGKNQNLLRENRCVSKTSTSTTAKHGCRQENSQLSKENKDTHILQNTEEWRSMLKKSVPTHQLIQEQSEVQRHQEDNDEVASEMETPEMNENHKSVPTIERTASFPTLLKQSMTSNSILENQNFDSTEVANPKGTNVPELSQLLKILPQSGFPNPGLVIYSGHTGTSTEAFTEGQKSLLQSTHSLSEPRLPCGTTASALPAMGAVEERCLNPSDLLPEITQGEKMSQMLKEQTDQLKMKVEDFSKHKTEGTFLLQDDYQALNQLKRYLDALERNYLTAREEHRNLQLQCYNDTPINIGEFDPERKVEGEIFRLGTLLEDIQEQEQADGSKCISSPSLTSCESAHSSCTLWESSAVSSITDCPEENAVLPKNNEGENTSQTSCIISQKNARFSSECGKCHLCIHTFQKQAESTYKEMDPLGRRCLLASKYSSDVMRFFSPEGKYEAEGLGSHTQGTLSQKYNASGESMKGNNIPERKTGIYPIFSQGKPTDLSDTNLSSESEDISAYHSYGSQSDEFMKCESYKIFHTRQQRERKGFQCRCPRERQNQFKLQNYKESVQSCALRRNKNSGSASYSQKRTPSQEAQTNEQRPELINGLSESLPSKNSTRRKSAINIRNRNAKDFNINILTSTLDHAIQTANSLKKETERMVQAISEDLAKARRKQL